MARPRRGGAAPLTEAQHDEFGPFGWLDLCAGQESAFRDDEERRAAWEAHRDELMAEARREARERPLGLWRPWPWWLYDLGRDDPAGHPDGLLEEVRVLVEEGELTAEERAALMERSRDRRDVAVLELLERRGAL
jgi:hypothetical protein